MKITTKKARKAASKAAVKSLPVMRCFLACDYAGRLASDEQQGKGKTSLQGIFDSIWTEGVPAIYSQFYIFVQLEGGEGNSSVVITATGPSGELLLEMTSSPVKFQSATKAEIFAKVPIFPMASFGEIKFIASIGGEAVGWPLAIHVRKK